MTQIIDLDVFAPPVRSVKFTDRAGKALAAAIAENRRLLAGAEKVQGLRAWLSASGRRAAALRRRIAADERELEKHVHAFDATFLSFKSSLFLLEHLEEFRALAGARSEDINEQTYRLVLGIIEEIATQTDKALTVDFLFQNLTVSQGMELLKIAMATIMEYVQGNPLGAAGAGTEA